MAFQMWLQIPSQGHSFFDVNAAPDPRRSVASVFSLDCRMAFQMWLQIPSQGHSFFDVNATLDPRRSVTLVCSWVAL